MNDDSGRAGKQNIIQLRGALRIILWMLGGDDSGGCGSLIIVKISQFRAGEDVDAISTHTL